MPCVVSGAVLCVVDGGLFSVLCGALPFWSWGVLPSVLGGALFCVVCGALPPPWGLSGALPPCRSCVSLPPGGLCGAPPCCPLAGPGAGWQLDSPCWLHDGGASGTAPARPTPADNPLFQMDNVILTSHIASYSVEGDIAHQKRTAEILLQVVNGGLPERKVVINKDLYDQLAGSLQTAAV